MGGVIRGRFDVVNTEAVSELLEHLTRRLYGGSFAAGLNPAQWNLIRYLARSNDSARTITAFARFHATTPSSASQTAKLLITKGFVMASTSQFDPRSKRLDLTETGRALLAHDPLGGMSALLGTVDPAKLGAFAEVMEVLVRHAFGDNAAEGLSDGADVSPARDGSGEPC